MWWKKKPEFGSPPNAVHCVRPPERISRQKTTERTVTSPPVVASESSRTQLGRSLVFKGGLSGSEDIVIAGDFEGTLNVPGHCVTVGPEARVKGDIRAARVVIDGSVHGNISVRQRVEIHQTGHVAGDLIAQEISVADGAYFKGKIEILSEGRNEGERRLSSSNMGETAA